MGSTGFIFTRFWIGKQWEAFVDIIPEYLLTLVWNIHVDYNAKESLKPIIVLAYGVLSAVVCCWLQWNLPSGSMNVSGVISIIKGVKEAYNSRYVNLLYNWGGHQPDLVSTASKVRGQNYGKWNIYKTILMMIMHYVTHWQWKVANLDIRCSSINKKPQPKQPHINRIGLAFI